MEEMEYNQFYISGFQIRRVWYEGEWRYCITDFVSYLTRARDPIRYIVKIRIRNVCIKSIRKENVRQFPLKTKEGNRIANCGNLYLLLSIVRIVPKKYRWRIRKFKSRVV